MSHLPPSHCIKPELTMQGRTSVSLPLETSKGSQQSKWKYSVSVSRLLQSHDWVVWMWTQKKAGYWTHIVLWTAQGQDITLFFSSEDGFFISSINGRKTIKRQLNDPVCCAVLVSNGFYFPRMSSISKCPSDMGFSKQKVSVISMHILA